MLKDLIVLFKSIKKEQLMFWLVNIVFIIINVFFYIAYRTGELAVDLSFLVNLILIIVFIFKHSRSEEFNPFHSVFLIFNYLFFIISPMIQTKHGVYPNTMLYKPNLVIKVNILIFVFNAVYYIVYQILGKLCKRYNEVENKDKLTFSKTTYFTVLIFSLVLFVIFFRNTLFTVLYKTPLLQLKTYQDLIVYKFLFCMPVFLVAFLLTQKNEFNKPVYIILFILSTFLLVWMKNPILERRNCLL